MSRRRVAAIVPLSAVKTLGKAARTLEPKYKSKWEREYHALLLAERRTFVEYEAIKIRLADGAWYTPDFLTVGPDGALEIHEVKGYWREAAKVRWKVAIEKVPFRFVLAQQKRGTWVRETVA